MSKNLLHGVRLEGATIIEHRADGPVAGKVWHGKIYGDLSVGIDWQQDAGEYRTTVFSPTNWDIKRDENFIFLRRKRAETHGPDMPWQDADLYTVTLPT